MNIERWWIFCAGIFVLFVAIWQGVTSQFCMMTVLLMVAVILIPVGIAAVKNPDWAEKAEAEKKAKLKAKLQADWAKRNK